MTAVIVASTSGPILALDLGKFKTVASCGSRKPRRPAGSKQQVSVVVYGSEPTRCRRADGQPPTWATLTARMASSSCQGWRTMFMADPMRLRRQA